MIRNFLLLVLGFFLLGSPASAAPKHGTLSRAIGRSAKFVKSESVSTAKFVVTSPAHPVSRLKQIVGAILTVPEPALDGGVVVGEALDKFAGLELKHNPFHYVYVAIDWVHDKDEAAQNALFGRHN